MNRPIKFRAWDKKKKKWLFEYEKLGGFSLIGETVLLGKLGLIKLEDWKNIEIMQYTGLKDKDGNEIYEGDIVKTQTTEHGIVRWIDQIDDGTEWTGWNLNYNNIDGDQDFEIIGNIYENPELIKDE